MIKTQDMTGEIDERVMHRGGLFKMARDTFMGGMRFWVGYVFVLLILLTAPFFWVLYELFNAQTLEDQVFWGIWTILVALMIIALKTWYWMEMSRNSLMREIIRLEVLLEARDK